MKEKDRQKYVDGLISEIHQIGYEELNKEKAKIIDKPPELHKVELHTLCGCVGQYQFPYLPNILVMPLKISRWANSNARFNPYDHSNERKFIIIKRKYDGVSIYEEV